MNDEIIHDQENSQPVETVDAQCQHCQEYLDGWKRAQADYANLKKDAERDKAEMVKYSNERLLHEILPAIDQFETALAYAPDVTKLPEEDMKKLKNWITGLQAVRSLWGSAFQSIGLEKVPVVGVFDPQMHEAVGSEENADLPSGHIIRVAQDGWRLHGKLLRPARVIISQ